MESEKKQCDILLKDVKYLDLNSEIKCAKTIAIDKGRIIGIDEPFDWECSNIFQSHNLLWMPGLIDGHTHTSQQLLRGRILDEKPVIWKRINVPFEATLTEKNSEISASLCALEMIRSGTTAFIDAGGKHVPTFAKVYEKSGLRGCLSYMTNDNPSMPDSLRIECEEGLARQKDLHQQLKGGLLQGIFSVTALTAASERMIRTIFSYAKEHQIPMETHMNEYNSEVYDFIGRYEMRPFEWLEKEGLIGSKFVAAHGISLSAEEMNIIKKYKIQVAHCPFSNCGKGVPSTPYLLSLGILPGFGSDGSGHGGVDLFREMRLFRSVMNVTHGIQSGDAQVMPAKQLLKMATQGNAPVFSEEKLGTIQVGAPADIIALKIDSPHIYPTNNLVNTIVESASGADVTHMIVGGNIIMKNREVICLDEEKIIYETKKTLDA